MNQVVYQLTKRRSGAIVFYINRITPGRRNILLLHGALGNAKRMMPLCLTSATPTSCFAISGDTANAASMANDLIAPIRATFNNTPFTVIAESFSGIVALVLAKQISTLQRIIMLDTPFTNLHVTRSLGTLIKAYEDREEQRASTKAFCSEFFHLDVDHYRFEKADYTSHLNDVHIPIVMITGQPKARR